MYDFQAGQTYSFQTVAPALLGNNFQNMLVQAVLNYDVAALFADLQAMHRNIYPLVQEFDPTIVNDPTQYTYLRVVGVGGVPQIIAVQWIEPSTITAIASQSAYIVIPNVLQSQVATIQAALVGIGLVNVSITLR
jgi:hypothetical protein